MPKINTRPTAKMKQSDTLARYSYLSSFLASAAMAIGAILIVACVLPRVALADIFEWEYIDPRDPGQGKQQSSTLVPDGAGVDAVPNSSLYSRNLTMAYLIGMDLTAANLSNATLADADLTGANVRVANFSGTTSRGLTAAQFYSTASYRERDLTGVWLGSNDLSGWNLAGQNLTDARFDRSTLTDSDLTGAVIRGADFFDTGLTATQFYSTASYQGHDLTGVRLQSHNLRDWDFSGQDFSYASFAMSTLNDANLAGARSVG